MSGEDAERAAATDGARVASPVETTLRILLNSVAYLMGVAVVRQPAGSDGVVASVGRMPWLDDRRLITLELPDDALPANHAVVLDWPVPFQAEWVGAPPRLLIARLVFQGRTVAVLLGTLVTRESIAQQTREAIDLSCELIASAIAGESAAAIAAPPPAPETEQTAHEPSDARANGKGATVEPERPRHAVQSELLVEDVRKGLKDATDARALGRVLRDAVNVITDASAFTIALFHLSRPDVAYRYKVVGPDRDSGELGRQHVDDGPGCYAARHDRRWHVFARDVAIREELEVRVREAIVLQVPMTASGEVFGVVTVQTFRPEGFSDHELRLIAAVVESAAPHFAQVRLEGRFQPERPPAPVVEIAPGVQEPSSPPREPGARDAQDVVTDLLRRCGGAGFATAFVVGVDPGAGVLRGELVSDGEAAREVDYALGISSGRFVVPLDDRYNAIARAIREGRIVPAPTAYEIARPALDFDAAQRIELLARGGRSVTLPMQVAGEAAGALILGPMADDPSFTAIETVRGYLEDASRELAALWGARAPQ